LFARGSSRLNIQTFQMKFFFSFAGKYFTRNTSGFSMKTTWELFLTISFGRELGAKLIRCQIKGYKYRLLWLFGAIKSTIFESNV
jgi:hypothetical protein